MPSNQDSSEQKLLKEFPEYGEGILSHCFKTTTPDEDGSELKMTALPIGFAVEWMKIIRNKAFDAGRAQGADRLEYAEKLLDDVVCLYVKNLEDDTSLMKRVRKLMKTRLDEGKSVTAVWGWLDDRRRLTPPKEQEAE